MQTSILVTGGTGLLGAHLLYRLTRDGHSVRATFRSSEKQELTRKIFEYYTNDVDKLWQKIDWVKLDLMDVTGVHHALEGILQVYHCAAVVSFDSADREKLMEVNVTTTSNVVNCCLDRKVEKLLHVSSVAALGRSIDSKVMDENSTWLETKENSTYARSKYLSELEVWRGIQEGLSAVIVNPSIILGPGDWQQGSGKLFDTIANGFRFYTTGVNAYVDVRDVALAIQLLMQSEIEGERFVLAAENKQYREVFQLIANELGVKGPKIHAKPWIGSMVWRMEKIRTTLFGGTPNVTRETAHTAHQINRYSSDKIRERMNFEFMPLEKTVRDFAEFYQKNKS